eukprot:6476532-Amphidinium_carterae.1
MEFLGVLMADLKTPHGCAHLSVSLSEGSLNDKLADAGRTLLSQRFASRIGCKTHDVKDHTSREDMVVSEAMFKLWVHTTGALLCTSAQYMCQPPHCFLRLLSSDVSQTESAMNYLRALWTSLLVLETEAIKNADARNFVRSLVWPRNVLVREWFLWLVCLDWTMSEGLKVELSNFAQSWQSSLICEHSLRDTRIQGQKASGKLSTTKMWHHLSEGTLLDEYARHRLPPPPADCSVTGMSNLPDELFEPDLAECSLTAPVLDEILNSNPHWASQSPLEYKNAVVRT